jgi:GNAT superfamily N-acetyltransferase
VRVTITAVDWADPVGAQLRRRDRAERGLPEDREPDDATSDGGVTSTDDDVTSTDDVHDPAHVEVFLIARDRLTGAAVACGALRPADPAMAHRAWPGPDERPPETGPTLVSGLFVVPEHRRRGLAQLVLAELELQARGLGWLTLRLEADAGRPAALALCTTAGYTRVTSPDGIPEGIVVFEKRLHHLS